MADGHEDEQPKSVVFISASDDEEDANRDQKMEIFEKQRNCETELETKENLMEFESKSSRSGVVIDLSSDEADFISDRSIQAEAMAVAVVVNKKKRKRSKKKKKKKIEESRVVGVVRAERPTERIAIADTGAIGVPENVTGAESHLMMVEAMEMEATGMLNTSVKAEAPSEKIEISEMDAIGTSNSAVLMKDEEDLGEFENKGFPLASVVIDLLYSSSDEVKFMADQRNGGEAAEVRKKKKRAKRKRKRRIEEERDVDVMRKEEPSETITTVDAEADGILEITSIAKESSETITTAADMETHLLNSFVKAEELLQKIKTNDNGATGTSAWKNEEDLKEFENKSFPSAAFIDLLTSSENEDEFITDQRESREALAVNEKKKKKKIKPERVVDLVMAEGPSKAVTVDPEEVGVLEDAQRTDKPTETQVVKISENATRAENHLAPDETMDMKATGISDNFVEVGEPSVKVEAADKDTIGTSENAVLRKLLRSPRYFDPFDYYWETSYSCGMDETKDCSRKKRKKWKKPCFVCLKFGHTGNCCTKWKYCHNCRRIDHLAKYCLKEHLNGSQEFKVCLRCGDAGHDMPLCMNDYPPDDTKRIQCYNCNSIGHLCCLNIIDPGPREISCYNCGQSGHTGGGCAKPHGERSIALPFFCFRCVEDGHLSQDCTKSTMEQVQPAFQSYKPLIRRPPLEAPYLPPNDSHFRRQGTNLHLMEFQSDD